MRDGARARQPGREHSTRARACSARSMRGTRRYLQTDRARKRAREWSEGRAARRFCQLAVLTTCVADRRRQGHEGPAGPRRGQALGRGQHPLAADAHRVRNGSPGDLRGGSSRDALVPKRARLRSAPALRSAEATSLDSGQWELRRATSRYERRHEIMGPNCGCCRSPRAAPRRCRRIVGMMQATPRRDCAGRRHGRPGLPSIAPSIATGEHVFRPRGDKTRAISVARASVATARGLANTPA